MSVKSAVPSFMMTVIGVSILMRLMIPSVPAAKDGSQLAAVQYALSKFETRGTSMVIGTLAAIHTFSFVVPFTYLISRVAISCVTATW